MDRIKICKIQSKDWELYKKIRLESLKENPEAFGMDYQDVKNFSNEYWINELNEASKGIKKWLLFAKFNGEIVGMLGGERFKSEDLKDTAKVVAVFVSKKARGKGIAKKLLLNLLDEFRKSPGFKKARVKVFINQNVAIKLYQSAGFSIVDKITERWPSGRIEQTFIMEIPL